jgi:hypothetical protein
MSGRGKGGKVSRSIQIYSSVADCAPGSRKGRRQASPQDPPRQHTGHYKARHPSSRSSRWCQAYLRSYLRRDPGCSQDLFGECSYRFPPSKTLAHLFRFRSSVIRSHTPSTLSERLSLLSMSSTPLSGQDVLSTVSVPRCWLGSVSICYFVPGVYCIILIFTSLFHITSLANWTLAESSLIPTIPGFS